MQHENWGCLTDNLERVKELMLINQNKHVQIGVMIIEFYWRPTVYLYKGT